MTNNPRIKIDVIPSGMQAYVTLRSQSMDAGKAELEKVTAYEVLEALHDSGVSNGIDPLAIDELILHYHWNEKTLVASGTPPVRGEDGVLTYYFNTDNQAHPKVQTDGRVDYHDIGIVQCVEKDQLLVKNTLPTRGIPGLSVLGVEIPPLAGNDVMISAGVNTYFSNSDRTELRATIAGSASLKRGQVQVDNSLIIKGDVGLKTGNIDFLGDVVIQGDVHSTFKICAGGKVEISGLVEDAIIEAKGDVLIKGGFKGLGRGQIHSDGNIFIRFIEQQIIHSKASVFIGVSCLHSFITAGDTISVSTGPGLVVGSHLRAGKAINIGICGNQQHTQTILELVSDQTEISAAIHEKDEQIAASRHLFCELKGLLGKMQQRKAAALESDAKLLEQIRSLQDQLHCTDAQLNTLQEERDVIVKSLSSPGVITVSKKVFPGSQVVINEVGHNIFEELGKTTFSLANGEISYNENKHAVESGALA